MASVLQWNVERQQRALSNSTGTGISFSSTLQSLGVEGLVGIALGLFALVLGWLVYKGRKAEERKKLALDERVAGKEPSGGGKNIGDRPAWMIPLEEGAVVPRSVSSDKRVGSITV